MAAEHDRLIILDEILGVIDRLLFILLPGVFTYLICNLHRDAKGLRHLLDRVMTTNRI